MLALKMFVASVTPTEIKPSDVMDARGHEGRATLLATEPTLARVDRRLQAWPRSLGRARIIDPQPTAVITGTQAIAKITAMLPDSSSHNR